MIIADKGRIFSKLLAEINVVKIEIKSSIADIAIKTNVQLNAF
jgi:hypothetical protein